MKRIIATCAAVLVLASACSMKKLTTGVIGKIGTDGMVAIEGEQDVAFARESLPSVIKTLEVLRFGDPKDRRVLALLSKAYGTYAFGFVEQELLATPDGSPEHAKALARANLFYSRGRDYGIEALKRDGSVSKAWNAHFSEFQRAINGLGKKQMAALFWTSFNWASWINLNRDDVSAVVDIPKIQAMIDRVIQLDPDYYYGSARAFKGVLAISRPSMLGGDPTLAQAEFSAAMGAAPDYLMTKVLYAQYYARQMNDAALFKKTLTDVESADAAKLPEQRLANELAKLRARTLLGMEKRLF